MDKNFEVPVSIIIPVFNDQKGVIRCLKFIEYQSYPISLIEVVVVDNGSVPPITLDSSYGYKVKLIRCEKPGSYAARNAGVKIASGDIFAFTDADCWPEENWIKSGVVSIQHNGAKAFVGGEVEIIKPSNPSAVAIYQSVVGFGQESNIKEKKFTGTLNLFCTKALFSSVGYFEERLLSGGDREWSWRALKRGFFLIYESRAITYTEPRTTLRAAIRQTRRIAAGRKILCELGLTHMGSQNIAKQKTAWQSLVWIFNQNELSITDRVRVFSVALIIRSAETVERIRLALGAKAERR